MTKKKAFVALAVLVLGGSVAVAQTASAQPPGPGQHLDKMATLLDLTETQKQLLQQIFEEQHAQMKALMQQAQASGEKPTREQMRTTHEQMQQQLLSKVQGILSADQFKKFQILTEHPRWGHRGPPGPPPAEAPPGTN
jgi:Spy/CpxP family protein refolding chaperone